MASLKILSCGAHASIQDFGRPGSLILKAKITAVMAVQ